MISARERKALCYLAANPDLEIEVVAAAAGMPGDELAALAALPAGQRFVRAMRGVPELLEGYAVEVTAKPAQPATAPPAPRPAPGPSPVKATRVDETELSDYMQSLVARAYLAIE